MVVRVLVDCGTFRACARAVSFHVKELLFSLRFYRLHFSGVF